MNETGVGFDFLDLGFFEDLEALTGGEFEAVDFNILILVNLGLDRSN